mmetsp:Transcript_48218/g.82891  ORF Transcript_48218/g.82891 Transcript_48218/m.82891 type:complete len:279 (+) Transcript_48218:326-1162(+)
MPAHRGPAGAARRDPGPDHRCGQGVRRPSLPGLHDADRRPGGHRQDEVLLPRGVPPRLCLFPGRGGDGRRLRLAAGRASRPLVLGAVRHPHVWDDARERHLGRGRWPGPVPHGDARGAGPGGALPGAGGHRLGGRPPGLPRRPPGGRHAHAQPDVRHRPGLHPGHDDRPAAGRERPRRGRQVPDDDHVPHLRELVRGGRRGLPAGHAHHLPRRAPPAAGRPRAAPRGEEAGPAGAQRSRALGLGPGRPRGGPPTGGRAPVLRLLPGSGGQNRQGRGPP